MFEATEETTTGEVHDTPDTNFCCNMRVTIKEYSFSTLNCSLICAPISISAAYNCSSIQFLRKGTGIVR